MQVILTLTKKGTINMTIASSNWGFSIGFNKATCEKKRSKFRSWQHGHTTALLSATADVLANYINSSCEQKKDSSVEKESI